MSPPSSPNPSHQTVLPAPLPFPGHSPAPLLVRGPKLNAVFKGKCTVNTSGPWISVSVPAALCLCSGAYIIINTIKPINTNPRFAFPSHFPGAAHGPELSFLVLCPPASPIHRAALWLPNPDRSAAAGAFLPPSMRWASSCTDGTSREKTSIYFPWDCMEARQLRPQHSHTARWQLRRAHGGDGADGGFPQPE